MKLRPLYVKPILLYSKYQKQPLTSWRAWGAITSEDLANEEARRIEGELSTLKASVDYPLEVLEVDVVSLRGDVLSMEDKILKADVVLLYVAGGGTDEVNEIARRNRTILFIRWRSGHYYLWHEIVDARLVRMNVSDTPVNPWVRYEDIIVDDYTELDKKLRALYALKNIPGRRILCIGGAWGWEVGNVVALNAARTWKLEVVTIPYSELERELKYVEENEKELVEKLAREYISEVGVDVKVPFANVCRGFALYKALKNLASRYEADVVTSPGCMSTVIRIAKTPPCLPYSILNDEDLLCVCEGDFVAIPAFLLLRFISGKPVFFANPTLPHRGEVLVAHCTAPRIMNGRTKLPVEIYTHYESDEGVAVRVLFNKGQVVTVVNPSFDGRKWVIFKGEVTDTPFYPACRTQVIIKIHGDWHKMRESMKGFHWLIVYGDYVDSVEYAARKSGIEPLTI